MKLSKTFRNNRLLIFLTSLLVLLIGLPVIIFLIIKRNVATAAWFDTDWTNRKAVTVGNTSGSTLSNEDVLVTVDTAALITASKLQADCGDLRFLDNDDTTVITYWIEGGCNTSTTQVWVRIPSLPNGGKTIYMYYNNAAAANGEESWSGNMTLLADANCPAGWTRNTGFDSRFPYGNVASGALGGSPSHTHGDYNGNTSARGSSSYNSGANSTAPNHTHSYTMVTNTNAAVWPPYLQMIFCYNQDLDLKSGLITLYDTTVPAGWTRFSALDDRLPTGLASYGGAGGSATHSHTFNAGTTGSVSASATVGAGSDYNMLSGSHSHTWTAGTTSTDSNMPPYLDMIYGKSSGTSIAVGSQPIIMTTVLPPRGWTRFSALDDKFPRGAASYGGTGGSATHTHTVSKTTANSGSNFVAGSGAVASGGGSHNHIISFTTNSQSNLPYYLTTIFAKRKTSQSTSLGSEESPVPDAPTAQAATPTSTSSITWNFTDNSSDEQGFKVYDSIGNLKVTCATPNILSCLESTLSENTQYTRKFTAYNAFGDSEFSSTTSAYTLISTPTISGYSSTVDSVDLTASAVANISSGSSGYYFDCTVAGGDNGINAWITTDTDISTGLDNNTGYTYQVKARNGDAVETGYSPTQEVWTKAVAPTLSISDFTDTTVTLGVTGVNNLAQGSSGIYFECVGGGCSTGIDTWVTTDADTSINLIPNTQYTFKAKARNYDSVETAYSGEESTYTRATQPTISSITNMSENEMTVTINPYSNTSATLYVVEEVNTAKYITLTGALDVAPVWLTYAQLGSASGIEVTGLDSNTEYTFRVKAKNSEAVETGYSVPLSQYTILTAPTSVTLTPDTDTDTTIDWRLTTTENGYDGVKVYNDSSELVKTCVVANGTMCQEGSLTPNTLYTRKLTIYSTHSESGYSNSLSVRTHAQDISIISTSTINDYEVSLTLDLGDNPAGTNIQIYEEGLSKYYDDTLGILVVGESQFIPSSNTVTISGLSPNTLYTFKVRALDEESNPTTWSATENVRTEAEVPNIVTTTPSSTTAGSITIDMGDNPAATRISIFETSSEKYPSSTTNVLEDSEDIFVMVGDTIAVNGLLANTSYIFKVKAYNTNDVGTDWSSTLDLTTLIEQPVVVVNSSAVLTISGLSNISEGNSGIFVEDIGTWSKELSQTVTGLTPNTSYTFDVKARNSDGVETAYVTSGSVITLANTPVVSSVTKVSSTSARVFLSLNGNPSTTQIAIRDRVSDLYVNIDGTLQTSAVWQTYSQWGGSNGKYITGINTVRQLGFEAKARNGDSAETGFSDAVYIGTGGVIVNAPEDIALILKEDTDTDVTTTGLLGIQDIQITKDDYLLLELSVSFEEDRDWNDIVVDADIEGGKAVVKINEEHGITEAFTMYVVMVDSNAFRICPQATTLDEVNSDCIEGILVSDTFPQEVDVEGNIITISQAKIDDIYYWIADGLTGTGCMGEMIEQEETSVTEEEETTIVSVLNTFVERAKEVAVEAILGNKEVLDNTIIGTLNEEGLANVVTTMTTITITVGVATTGLSQTFYLILHFLNSLLNVLGFRRKKIPFGYVYDSKSKDPIRNAVVRIFKGKDLLETTVTDSNGIFVSKLDSGKYKIEVKKSGYVFPSKLIKGTNDYPLKHIYKGGLFKKSGNLEIAVSIPLDQKELKGGKRVLVVLKSILSISFSILNVAFFGFGVSVLIYTYYKYQDMFNLYIVLLYIPALYLLIQSLCNRRSRYGKLVDSKGHPISNKEILLVEDEFEEVVDKRVTDKKGRFKFICKKGKYSLMMGKDVLVDGIVIKKDGKMFVKRVVIK